MKLKIENNQQIKIFNIIFKKHLYHKKYLNILDK